MDKTSQLLDALRQIDTPTVSNVIELFDVIPRNQGYTDGRIKAQFPDLEPMVGFAATATFRSDQPPAGGDAYASLERQVEQIAAMGGPAVVVFQDIDDPPVSATFGEVMCSTYKAFGSTGLITSGAGRDIEQVRRLNYPVFTGGTICSHAYCHILHLGLPVRVGGLNISQGELLHGDANGVTRIPIEIADEIPQAAKEFVTAEQIMLDYVWTAGEKSAAEFAERRVAFQAEVKKLRGRLSRSAGG